MIILKNNTVIRTPYENINDSILYSKLYKKIPEQKIINMINLKKNIDKGCSYGEKIDTYIKNIFQ